MEEKQLLDNLIEHRKALNTFRMLVEVLPEDENLVEAKRIFVEQVNHSNQTFRFAMNDINEFVQERDKTQADREELFNAQIEAKALERAKEIVMLKANKTIVEIPGTKIKVRLEELAEDEKEANDLLIAKAEKERAPEELDDKYAVLMEFKMVQLKEMALGVGMEPKAINKLRSKKALAKEIAKRQ